MTTKAKAPSKRQTKPVPPKRRRGRPVAYDVETAKTAILSGLACGRSLSSICKDPGLPSRDTVLNWKHQDPDFSAVITRARMDGQDAHVDQCQDIEADVLKGKIAPDAARVAIWSKQWRAARLKPQDYGEKTQVDATVKHSWADFVEEVAAKRLAEAKVIEGEMVDKKDE